MYTIMISPALIGTSLVKDLHSKIGATLRKRTALNTSMNAHAQNNTSEIRCEFRERYG